VCIPLMGIIIDFSDFCFNFAGVLWCVLMPEISVQELYKALAIQFFIYLTST